MSTIELYKDKINSMSNYIEQAKTAVSDYCTDLSALKSKILGINSSVCDSIVSKISSSSQTQEQQIAGLEATRKEVNDFIDLTINRDNSASSAVAEAKKEFYKQYDYLKPECEKSDWEKFCDKLEDVGEWCKEHWKLIVTVVICIAAIALICTGVGGILGAAALGALIGAGTGGLIGGISSVMAGGSFLDGFEDGAFSGAITGAIMGGLAAGGSLLGSTLGKSCEFVSKFGSAIKWTSRISTGASAVMDGFDTLALPISLFDSDNPLVQFNQKLHSSKVYNAFQVGVNAVAVFSGGMSHGMSQVTPSCFIAGTMVLTTVGLVAIEKIKAGDIVISTNPDTLETAGKTVLETYVRQVDKLVHLTINGEEIVTTDNHPFYVQGRGFINAGNLLVGDKLISVNGQDLLIEDYYIELTEEPVSVYNFQVEDFHTYFVGNCAVWVHNAECTIEFSNKSGLDDKEYKQQLKDQQDGLSELTIDEYQKNRSAYNQRKAYTGSGRDPNSAKYQAQAKKEAIKTKTREFRAQGYSKSEAESMAKDWAKGKAALHGPDQIVGGNADNISGLGDSKINSSIGSQWKSRVGTLDNYINEKAATLPGSTKLSELDIEFVLK